MLRLTIGTHQFCFQYSRKLTYDHAVRKARQLLDPFCDQMRWGVLAEPQRNECRGLRRNHPINDVDRRLAMEIPPSRAICSARRMSPDFM